jgi:hypothetical protein
MKPLRRLLLIFALFTALVVGVCQYRPGWATERGLDLWKSLKVFNQMGIDLRISAELEARNRDVLRRIKFKCRLVKGLIENRQTLREAARLLLEEDALSPAVLDLIRRSFPGKSDEEVLCRHLIEYTRGVLRLDPGRAQIVIARLEAELQAELEHGDLGRSREGSESELWHGIWSVPRENRTWLGSQHARRFVP